MDFKEVDYFTVTYGDSGIMVDLCEEGTFTTHYFSTIDEAKSFLSDMGMF